MKKLDVLAALSAQSNPINQARAQVAAAETVVQIAKEGSRAAKRERKLAREAARQAKKRLKKAKKELANAKRVLECAEKRMARDSRVTVQQRTPKSKKTKTRMSKKDAPAKIARIKEELPSPVDSPLTNESPVEEITAADRETHPAQDS